MPTSAPWHMSPVKILLKRTGRRCRPIDATGEVRKGNSTSLFEQEDVPLLTARPNCPISTEECAGEPVFERSATPIDN